MSRMILDGRIVENDWRHLSAEEVENEGIPESGNITVPLPVWKEHGGVLRERAGGTGIWLEPGEEPEEIADDLKHLDLVAIHFPAHKDGRGYSYARELRTRYGFTGEVRAVGDVLQDQLFYMHRVGFNGFEVREDRDIEEALEGLKVFSVTYQGDVHDPRPIFRRVSVDQQRQSA